MGAAVNAREHLLSILADPDRCMCGDDCPTPAQLADAHAAEVTAAAYRAAADEIDAQQQREETTERALHGFLDHETELQGAAVRGMAQRLRARADQMGQQ